MKLSLALKISFVIICFFLGRPVLKAEAELIDSLYFEVNIHEGADVFAFYTVILRDQLSLVELVPVEREGGQENLLIRSLDGLYEDVSDVLDIHLRDFKIKLEVFPARAQFHHALPDRPLDGMKPAAQYAFLDNTIYVFLDELTVGQLAHEIAHAVISHYFVVPPPAKVQEILSGYVDFKIRKNRLKSAQP